MDTVCCSVAQWSLPLPTRSSLPTASSASHSDVISSDDLLTSRASLRGQLHDLGLPAAHVDSVLLERDASLLVSSYTIAHPTEHWIDRTMDRMYREEHTTLSKEHAAVTVQIAPATAGSSLSGSTAASAPVATATTPICGICWDPILVEVGVAALPSPSCQVSCKDNSAIAVLDSR
jgi:hypothetical protein